MEMMFKDAFIQGGNVTVRADFDGNYAGSFGGANAFSKSGMITMPYEEFEAACPPLRLPASFSARGLITQMRMQGRMAPDVHQKIASAVMDSSIVKHASQAFEWDLSKLPDSPDEVEVQARKLTHYLLDPEHEDGKSKAAFFAQVLGITRGHWSFLQTQLIDGLAHVSYENVRLDRHGIRFSAVLPVKGCNGATATIRTAWIVRAGERASLVTAFPSRKDANLEILATTPAVVPHELTGAARWQAIFDLADKAGQEAAEACVPKPMVVQGLVYMDGSCGSAFVVVHDARRICQMA